MILTGCLRNFKFSIRRRGTSLPAPWGPAAQPAGGPASAAHWQAAAAPSLRALWHCRGRRTAGTGPAAPGCRGGPGKPGRNTGHEQSRPRDLCRGATARCKINTSKQSKGKLCVCRMGALLAVPLYFLGFSSTGPVAGTYAAGWMSSIATAGSGGVVSGSAFATCQSIAMGGAAAGGSVWTGLGAVGTAIIAAL